MMKAEMSLFGNDSKQECETILKIVKPVFKNIWKLVSQKEKLNPFRDENPNGISKEVKKYLAENNISVKYCKGTRNGIEHDFLVAPATDGEIIIDCKNRIFNSFQSRLKIFTPNDKEYDDFTILSKKK